MAAIVGPLRAVNEWAAFERDQAGVVFDSRIGQDAADRHRQRKVYRIARFPLAPELRVTMVHAGVHNLAIDFDYYRAVGKSEKAVQVTGHHLVACPARNADVNGEIAG